MNLLKRQRVLPGAVAVALLALTAHAAPARPNILFVLTDDQRWDALGYAGNPVIQTPNLDRLAGKGIYFSNAFVTTAICCASRASILTGQYEYANGVENFVTPVNLEVTYPRYLREAGYYTGFIGKWGTGEGNTNYFIQATDLFDFWGGSMGQANYWHERNCNFVRNNGTSGKHHFFCDCPPDARGIRGEGIRIGKANMKDPIHQETDVVPMKVRSFLDQRDPQKPFCLSISFKSPHGPWSDFDERFKNDYQDVILPVAASATEAEAMSRPEFLRNSMNSIGLDKVLTARQADGPLQKSMKQYYRLINGVDYAVGKILDELQARGLTDNTVIIFYSDNGHFMAEHGFTGKWLMYEESIRVPGFIYDPRHPGNGKRSSEMVLNIDLAPTILDLAGWPVPESMQGKSLLPLLADPNQPLREDFYYEHHYHLGRPTPNIERSQGVRTRDWTYIRYIDQQGAEAEELYHVSVDPLELKNLSQDPESAVVRKQMEERYQQYCTMRAEQKLENN